jgi:four helix bundle protein
MAKVTRVEELLVWCKARRLAARIDELCTHKPLSRNFALVDQIRRASLSISFNIAEGFELQTPKQFRRFLWIAKGSTAELRAAFYLCEDRNYLDARTCASIRKDADEIARRLRALIQYLNKAP